MHKLKILRLIKPDADLGLLRVVGDVSDFVRETTVMLQKRWIGRHLDVAGRGIFVKKALNIFFSFPSFFRVSECLAYP